MELLAPSDTELAAFALFEPLAKAARRAREKRCIVPLLLDEFRFFGRIPRAARPDLYVYEHVVSKVAITVDADGRAYRFLPSRKDPYRGQFRPMSLRSAIWQAVTLDAMGPSYRWPDDDTRDWDAAEADDDEPRDPVSWADRARRERQRAEWAEEARREDAERAAEAATAGGVGTVRRTVGNLSLVVTDDGGD